MDVVVVGAGAWGLAAAAELARRGNAVTVVDDLGPGNARSSSFGPTRLWRLSHPDSRRVRLALRSVAAWHRLERRAQVRLLDRRGLLWRGGDAPQVAASLAGEGVACTLSDGRDAARWFPGLRTTDTPVCWQPDAGPVWARRALDAHRSVLERHGGRVLEDRVDAVDAGGPSVLCRTTGRLPADVVVVAAGPRSAPLLADVEVDLSLRPVLQQVTYLVGRGDENDLPCVYDVPEPGQAPLYAMPTPGLGYKLGIDRPLRDFAEADADRTPDSDVDRETATRAARDYGFTDPRVVGSQVCVWTESSYDRFVVDRVGDVVLAASDGGQGFKFSALMGEWLADLADGAPVDDDQTAFGVPPAARRRAVT